MIVKYESIGDKYIVNFPKDSHWEIYMKTIDERGDEVHELCLFVNGKEHILSDAETWCTGRNIPESEIDLLHEDVIDKILEQINNNPDLPCIDIEKIIDEVVTIEYKERWLNMRFIKLSPGGSW